MRSRASVSGCRAETLIDGRQGEFQGAAGASHLLAQAALRGFSGRAAARIRFCDEVEHRPRLPPPCRRRSLRAPRCASAASRASCFARVATTACQAAAPAPEEQGRRAQGQGQAQPAALGLRAWPGPPGDPPASAAARSTSVCVAAAPAPEARVVRDRPRYPPRVRRPLGPLGGQAALRQLPQRRVGPAGVQPRARRPGSLLRLVGRPRRRSRRRRAGGL